MAVSKPITNKIMPVRRKPKPLRLYVWTDFSRDYTGDLAFAVARSEDSARRLVIEKHGFEPHDWGDLTVHPLSKPMAFTVSGGG